MEKVKVSIIVPAYNAEKTIYQCVESISSQTYDNLEIIIVNDGSTDNTIGILRKIEEKDKRIKVIDTLNGGSSNARNKGLSISTGEYIFFVDADDTIEKNMIKDMIEIAIDNDLDVVVCGITIKYIEENYCVQNGFEKSLISNNDSDLKEIIYETCNTGMIYSPCNKAYKSRIIKENNLLFSLNMEPIEDILFNCNFFKLIKNIGVVNIFPYYYNKRNQQSNVTKYRRNMWYLSDKRSESIKELFKKFDMNDNENLQFLYSEYIGGKADCISNCFRENANLNLTEKYKMYKKFIFEDDYLNEVCKKINKKNLFYDKKILIALLHFHSALLMLIAYEFLFFARYKFKNIYFLIRKRKVR